MMSTITSGARIIIVIAVLALSMTIIGCGTDNEQEAEKYFGRVRKESRPEPAVAETPTEPAVEPEPAPPAEEPVAEPAPPREVTYDEAEAAYHARRYSEAIDLFTGYTERKSENPWGYYMLGLSAWKAGEYGTAEEALGRALELDPRHVKSWINLSRVLLDGGRPEEAIATIDSALAIDPELDVAHRLQGRVYHQLGRTDEAIEAYRRAIRIDNNDAWSMNNMGLILIETGRYEDALAPLARAVALRDDISIFQNNLGMALEHTGRMRAAQDAYSAAVAIDETYEKAYANLLRVAEVSEDPAVGPVDLVAIAERFVEEIESWTVAAQSAAPVDTMPPEPMYVVPGETQGNSGMVDVPEIAASDSIGSHDE